MFSNTMIIGGLTINYDCPPLTNVFFCLSRVRRKGSIHTTNSFHKAGMKSHTGDAAIYTLNNKVATDSCHQPRSVCPTIGRRGTIMNLPYCKKAERKP
jgi:hypothetical protein